MILRWLMRPGLAVNLALMVSVLVFGLWPELDLQVSRAFWSPEAGFIHAEHPAVQALYRATPWAGRALLVVLLLLWVWGQARPRRVARPWRQRTALMLGIAVFGLGLFIDVGLKDHWGRPRPRDTAAFGGSAAFQPALLPSSVCKRNCSFVSGHAAFGFYLLAFGLLSPPQRRRRWLWVGIAAGSLIGLGRVAQGGHYLSDVVFSFFAVWLSMQAVWAALRAMNRWRAWRRALARQRVQWRPDQETAA